MREVMKKKILVVDDEKDLLDLLADFLKKNNYVVTCAETSDEALGKIDKLMPDMVLLDLKLPTIGGLEVLKQLRQNKKTARIPVIILTVEADDMYKIMGLEIGADDYMTKPFNQRELLARIKAIFRRIENTGESEEVIRHGELYINTATHMAYINDKSIELRPKEFDMLYLLMAKKGRVLSRDFLTECIWGEEYYATSRTVDITMSRLRNKLKNASKCIKTVGGVGYKFDD